MNDKKNFSLSDENLEQATGGNDFPYLPFYPEGMIGQPLSAELVTKMQTAHPDWKFINEVQLDDKPALPTEICITHCPECGYKMNEELIYRVNFGFRGDLYCHGCGFRVADYVVREMRKF